MTAWRSNAVEIKHRFASSFVNTVATTDNNGNSDYNKIFFYDFCNCFLMTVLSII